MALGSALLAALRPICTTKKRSDNHVTVLRPKKYSIQPSILILASLNTLAGQYQVNKWRRGHPARLSFIPMTSLTLLSGSPQTKIQQSIRKAIDDAFRRETKRIRLSFRPAKRACRNRYCKVMKRPLLNVSGERKPSRNQLNDFCQNQEDRATSAERERPHLKIIDLEITHRALRNPIEADLGASQVRLNTLQSSSANRRL